MYTYAELPNHPGMISSSDSDSNTSSLICGLCAKGPEARQAWKTNSLYCFTKGKVR